MSDDRVRELERLASRGDVEAQVRWVLERVRTHELPPARVQLACALLGLSGVDRGASLELHVRRVLEPVVVRPAMYLGSVNIFHMGHFVLGLFLSLEDFTASRLLGAWSRWIQQRYLVAGAAWSWERVLLWAHDSPAGARAAHAAAIQALPSLFEEFFPCFRELGAEGIERLFESRMLEVRGALGWGPDPDPTYEEWLRWTRGASPTS